MYRIIRSAKQPNQMSVDIREFAPKDRIVMKNRRKARIADLNLNDIVDLATNKGWKYKSQTIIFEKNGVKAKLTKPNPDETFITLQGADFMNLQVEPDSNSN